MENAAPGLFSDQKNKAALERVSSILSEKDSHGSPSFIPYLRTILRFMISAPIEFDKYSPINSKWIGKAFIDAVREFKQTTGTEEDLADIFTMAYRFLSELQFSMPEDLTIELRQVISFAQDNLNEFSSQHQRQLIYASFIMPASIARELLHHPHIESIRSFNENQDSAAKLKQQWDDEIASKEKRVEALRTELSGLETGFNFVGLVHGFKNLVDQKKAEQRFAFWCLVALGIAVTTPLLFELWLIVSHQTNFSNYKDFFIYAVPPAIAMELILIYFFRVVLLHFRSVKAQLLQLEFRATLCQFIQSYATYSSEIKKTNNVALEKFESLVFSGLLSNEDKLPATFDGADQIVKLFKSARNQ
ncbi:hypothetical protein ACNI65_14205 [Roseateles sp. So40a]|uniref:hypothetical protein n=1 Tax=Roseateles sp. So40a TaxID=3400226 RepID=UPI003A8AC8E3